METEAKFTVQDEQSFASLQSIERIGPYERRPDRVKQVHDRYLDTEGHSFYSRQFAARLREGTESGVLLLTLKRIGGQTQEAVHTRDEYETAVQNLNVAHWPEGDVRRLAEEITEGQPLLDLVTVDQTRFVSYLYQGERRVAEMSLDEITIQTPNSPTQAYELEVELMPEGDISDLRIISRLLIEEYGLTAQPLSKFERALALSSSGLQAKIPAHNGKPPAEAEVDSLLPVETTAKPGKEKRRIGIMPQDSMSTAGKKILRSFYADMLSNEEGTRAGKNPEAVHDIRVASRRMRAALRVLGPYMSKEAQPVRRGLRSMTRSLGAVRDLDVLLQHAVDFREQLPAEQQADLDGLLEAWKSKRKKARKELLRHLDSKDYTKFKRNMEKFLDRADGDESSPDQTAGAQPYQVRHVAGSTIVLRYDAVRAYETVMDAPTVNQLHALRVTGRYLRYTLECFRETLPPDTKGMIRDIVAMQDQLGEMQDAEVASQLIRAYLGKTARKGKGKEQAITIPPGLAAYLAEREATVRRIHTQFRTTWANLISPEWRARLASVVTSL